MKAKRKKLFSDYKYIGNGVGNANVRLVRLTGGWNEDVALLFLSLSYIEESVTVSVTNAFGIDDADLIRQAIKSFDEYTAEQMALHGESES